MSDLNQVTLSGRIGKDPETKFMESGSILFTFSMAVNKWSKKDNQEVASWFDVKMWLTSKQLDYFSRTVTKGAKVVISGELDQERWQNKEGQNRSRVTVLARDIVTFAPPKNNDGGQSSTSENIPF